LLPTGEEETRNLKGERYSAIVKLDVEVFERRKTRAQNVADVRERAFLQYRFLHDMCRDKNW